MIERFFPVIEKFIINYSHHLMGWFPYNLSSVDQVPFILIISLSLSFLGGFIPIQQPVLWSFLKNLGHVFYRRLNRPERSEQARLIRGILITLFMIAAVLFSVRALLDLFVLSSQIWLLIQTLLLMSLLSTTHSWHIALKVTRLIEKKQYGRAAEYLSFYTQDDLLKKDPHQISRQAIIIVARHIDRFLVAPLFYFLLVGLIFQSDLRAGLYSAIFYTIISALKFSSSYRQPHARPYVRLINILDLILHYIPDKISGVIIILACFLTPKVSGKKALFLIRKKGKELSHIHWSILAFSGALSITLLGPALQKGLSSNQPWVGNKKSSAKATGYDIRRAIAIHITIIILVFCLAFFSIYLM